MLNLSRSAFDVVDGTHSAAKLKEEMGKLAVYEKQMLASYDQQISLTDPDSPIATARPALSCWATPSAARGSGSAAWELSASAASVLSADARQKSVEPLSRNFSRHKSTTASLKRLFSSSRKANKSTARSASST